MYFHTSTKRIHVLTLATHTRAPLRTVSANQSSQDSAWTCDVRVPGSQRTGTYKMENSCLCWLYFATFLTRLGACVAQVLVQYPLVQLPLKTPLCFFSCPRLLLLPGNNARTLTIAGQSTVWTTELWNLEVALDLRDSLYAATESVSFRFHVWLVKFLALRHAVACHVST